MMGLQGQGQDKKPHQSPLFFEWPLEQREKHSPNCWMSRKEQ